MFWWRAFQFLKNVMIYLHPVYSDRFNLIRSVLRMCWSFQVKVSSAANRGGRTWAGSFSSSFARWVFWLVEQGQWDMHCVLVDLCLFVFVLICLSLERNVCNDVGDDNNNANARSPCGWQWSRLGWPSLVHGCVQVSYISSFARQILGIEQFPVNQSNDTIG